MTAPSNDELIDTLKSLQSEIVESRNLTIKTDNLIKNLSADVRQIGKRQDKYEKRYVFNSVAAYVLFSILIFAGLYLAFKAQVLREREAVDAANVRIGDLQRRVGELENELERRRESEEQAYSLVRLVEEDKRDELLQSFPVARGKLINRGEIELLRREVDRINIELAYNAYIEGAKAYKANRFEVARDLFLKSLKHVEKAHYSAELRFSLGMSLFQLKDYAGAIEHLRRALEYPLLKETKNDALYSLAVSLDHQGRTGEARKLYEEYAKRYAYDKRAPVAQKRVFSFIKDGIQAQGEFTIAE